MSNELSSAAYAEPSVRAALHKSLPAVSLVALVAVCYFPAFQGGYVMDDDLYVVKQPLNRSLDGLRRIWFEPRSSPQYYPLLHTSFWLQYQLWQLNPVGYHVVNVIMHACIVLLAWRILLRLEVPGAWLGAAIFAVHPVCVESVAWITKLMNLQSLLLALAAMWCYLQFEPPVVAKGPQAGSRRRYYALSLIFFVMALLSKTVVASLPAVLLVVYWWKRGRIAWRDFWPLTPFFFLGAALGLTTAWLERYNLGSHGPEWSFTLVERCLIAGRDVWFYASKLVWPYPLLFYYPRWTIDAGQWWQYMYPAGVLAVIAALWVLRNRIGRGPLAAVLIYVGVLFPALGFFNVYAFRYSFVTDHWQYHAMLAAIALLAAAMTHCSARLPARWRRVAYAITSLPLVAFGVRTFCQAQFYCLDDALYRYVIVWNNNSWIAHHNLGGVLTTKYKYEEALEQFHKALQLKPDEGTVYNNLAMALIDSGGRFGFKPGQLEEALQYAQTALSMGPAKQFAHVNLGRALMYADKPQEARKHFLAAIDIDPHTPMALYGMGGVLSQEEKWADAQFCFEEALKNEPDSAITHHALGNALAKQNDYRGAVKQYAEAIRLDPDHFEALHNLGASLIELGQPDQAVAYLKRAVKLKPDDAMAKDNLQKAVEAASKHEPAEAK